ncbi:MAG: DUF6478 family protein [Planktomarina sp.]
MAKQAGFLEKLTNKRSLRQWEQRAADAPNADLDTLKKHRNLARRLKGHLDKVLIAAEDQLSLVRPDAEKFRKTKGTDWSWRPKIWRAPTDPKGAAGVESGQTLAAGTTIFHDCEVSDLTYRQVRNMRADDLAHFGVRLDVFQFDGSFLSLVLDLPDECHNNLQMTHLFRMNAIIESERPLEIFARLNIKHGPNIEQIVRELPLYQDDVWVEFDLGYSKINAKRVEKLWLDLIFEGPDMNQITMRDITLSRTRRAEL